MDIALEKLHLPGMKKKEDRHLYDQPGCPQLKVINIGRVGRSHNKDICKFDNRQQCNFIRVLINPTRLFRRYLSSGRLDHSVTAFSK